MPIDQIKAFSVASTKDPELAAKLKSCAKLKELIKLGSDYGYTLDEVDLYPPNEPQFTEDQLSPKLAKALLRV